MNNSIELFVEHFSLYTKNDWYKILRLGVPVIRNHISILNIDTI